MHQSKDLQKMVGDVSFVFYCFVPPDTDWSRHDGMSTVTVVSGCLSPVKPGAFAGVDQAALRVQRVGHSVTDNVD